MLFKEVQENMKKLAILGTSLLILNGCSWATIPAAADDIALIVYSKADDRQPNSMLILVNKYEEQQEERRIQQEINKEQALLYVEELKRLKKFDYIADNFDSTLNKLINTAGKTRYTYSGHTPRGWDCSGLTMWFYGELGIEIPHSASAQSEIGILVEQPQVGDIIVVREPGRSRYHHSMIYIGDNKIIHSGLGRGDTTEILSLNNKYFDNVDMKIVRVN